MSIRQASDTLHNCHLAMAYKSTLYQTAVARSRLSAPTKHSTEAAKQGRSLICQSVSKSITQTSSWQSPRFPTFRRLALYSHGLRLPKQLSSIPRSTAPHWFITTTVRSAYWALAKELPHIYGNTDLELVTLGCILHDLGWAKTKELLSAHKRFGVDGAASHGSGSAAT